MSYNIDSVHEIVLTAYMRAGDVVCFIELEDELPESCFLHDLEEEALEAVNNKKPDTLIELKSLDWSGSFSGRSYTENFKKIAAKIVGEVEAILTWEGGDSVTGLLIKDGVAKECPVEYRLIKD